MDQSAIPALKAEGITPRRRRSSQHRPATAPPWESQLTVAVQKFQTAGANTVIKFLVARPLWQ
jgi:hypothetical protein